MSPHYDDPQEDLRLDAARKLNALHRLQNAAYHKLYVLILIIAAAILYYLAR